MQNQKDILNRKKNKIRIQKWSVCALLNMILSQVEELCEWKSMKPYCFNIHNTTSMGKSVFIQQQTGTTKTLLAQRLKNKIIMEKLIRMKQIEKYNQKINKITLMIQII